MQQYQAVIIYGASMPALQQQLCEYAMALPLIVVADDPANVMQGLNISEDVYIVPPITPACILAKTISKRLLLQDRLVEAEKPLNKMKIQNLAACFQDVAFRHLTRVLEYYLSHSQFKIKNIFVGGGVSANIEIRKRLRRLCDVHSVEVFFPKSKKLYGDNAAMIGVAAGFRAERKLFVKDVEKLDRVPRLSLLQSSIG